MIALVAALAVGFCFGAADQYLGSLITLGPWTVAASQMSAPWLILPLLSGLTQRRPGRAALAADLPGLLASNLANIAGGAVTGPLRGLIGWRARTGRRLPAAALGAAALCLEPAARVASGRLYPPYGVWRAEVATGLLVAAAAALTTASGRRARGAR